MITRSAPRWQTGDWQSLMKSSIRSLNALCKALDIHVEDLPLAAQAAQDFALKIPLPYLARIERGNPQDPLLLQVLPQAAETLDAPGFSHDPLEEADFNAAPGLIHKYHGRVLLITNPSCAVHCRYCFRRHFPYQENTPGRHHWQQALNYIAETPNIHEVILSGGDPLSSNDNYLQELIAAIGAIAHVRTLRIHSRLPVVLPQRITSALLHILTASRLKVLVVVHINHANEIDADVAEAITHIQQNGIRVMNQSVLLHQVNNNIDTLETLLWRLYELNIEAYYLHMLDKVTGTAHFQCNDEEALKLYQQLSARLPGYMLPRLVRETAHDKCKTALV